MKLKIDKVVIINLFIAIVSVALIGFGGRIFANSDSAWFISLTKPSEFIPNMIFPIVWSIIYICFGITIFLLLQQKTLDKCTLALIITNALLQILWCFVYFYLQQILLGLVVIVLTLVFSIILVVKLFSLKKYYFWIMLIYPVWLMLATLANNAIWVLN